MRTGKKEDIYVDIVLPTYNGEKYIEEQLVSIFRQTFRRFRIYVRDDGSVDQTTRIIQNYKKRYPNKICIIQDSKGKLGAANNVLEICRYTNAPYVMFCDQDDYWFEDKIKGLLKAIMYYERINKNIPILVFSEAGVANEKLQPLHKTFSEAMHYDPKRIYFSNLLQVNILQGASCIYNRMLIEKTINIKTKQVNPRTYHDWWIVVVASLFGKIYYYNKQLMYYRIHQNNTVGIGSYCGVIRYLLSSTQEEKDEFAYKHYLYVNKYLCRDIKNNFYEGITNRDREILDFFLLKPSDTKKFMKLKLYKQYNWKQIICRVVFGVT